MSKTRIQLHEEPHSGSGGGHTCMHKCMYLRLFVKGTDEQNA